MQVIISQSHLSHPVEEYTIFERSAILTSELYKVIASIKNAKNDGCLYQEDLEFHADDENHIFTGLNRINESDDNDSTLLTIDRVIINQNDNLVVTLSA